VPSTRSRATTQDRRGRSPLWTTSRSRPPSRSTETAWTPRWASKPETATTRPRTAAPTASAGRPAARPVTANGAGPLVTSASAPGSAATPITTAGLLGTSVARADATRVAVAASRYSDPSAVYATCTPINTPFLARIGCSSAFRSPFPTSVGTILICCHYREADSLAYRLVNSQFRSHIIFRLTVLYWLIINTEVNS